MRERFGFARDDADLVAALVQRLHGVDDVVVAADEPVVIRELVLAIRGDQRARRRHRRGRSGRTS